MFSKLTGSHLFQGAALTAGLLLSGSAFAGLINAEFDTSASDFGWSGFVVDEFGEIPVDLATDTSGVFSFSSTGSATITPTDLLFGGYIYQEFSVGADYDQLSLSYDYFASDDSFWGDIVNVALWFEGDIIHDFLDPSDGPSFDFSSLNVNDMVELRFGFEDWDFNYFDDYLTVSDIAISTKSAAPVPEPSTLAMFSLAMLALGHRRLSRKPAAK
ncbi:PEP-CTERM sorting domain-containing protein [Neiella sp. HB171785]|uniref:PEP-CTERM sorting domain-containing protein n=1 Tax=Neiella litorisoli TaxID=2771431 RepID=A0A8J6QPW8_9GAMM|nr:PEP-CTERM sorting domain-containing protein [Neiella litorisoli]MBD1388354.1 PEP-CTERM sorting domain-containing protein [Neiella litorisoli]